MRKKSRENSSRILRKKMLHNFRDSSRENSLKNIKMNFQKDRLENFPRNHQRNHRKMAACHTEKHVKTKLKKILKNTQICEEIAKRNIDKILIKFRKYFPKIAKDMPIELPKILLK